MYIRNKCLCKHACVRFSDICGAMLWAPFPCADAAAVTEAQATARRHESAQEAICRMSCISSKLAEHSPMFSVQSRDIGHHRHHVLVMLQPRRSARTSGFLVFPQSLNIILPLTAKVDSPLYHVRQLWTGNPCYSHALRSMLRERDESRTWTKEWNEAHLIKHTSLDIFHFPLLCFSHRAECTHGSSLAFITFASNERVLDHHRQLWNGSNTRTVMIQWKQ